MSRLSFGLAAAVAGLIVAPNLAAALPAVTTDSTNLRAGPAYDFPVVDRIPSGVAVNVHGCIRGYRWCDVSWRDARGWVPGEELAYLYQGRRVAIVEYGPRIHLPVVSFSFDTYWGRHYTGRSWYGERNRWRSVWRERERSGDRVGDRARDRRDGKVESRRDTSERQLGEKERRLDRRGDRNERPAARTERGERYDRSEARGYRPTNPSPRQETDRGMRQGGANAGGRMEPGARDRGPGGPGGGFDRSGPGQGERKQ
jgi:uncharacterized protein YraI